MIYVGDVIQCRIFIEPIDIQNITKFIFYSFNSTNCFYKFSLRCLILSNPSNYIVLCVYQKSWIKNKSKRFFSKKQRSKKICFHASAVFQNVNWWAKYCDFVHSSHAFFVLKLMSKSFHASNHFILTSKLCRRLFIFA